MNTPKSLVNGLKSNLSSNFFGFSAVVVFVVFVVLAIRYQIMLLDYLTFGDEAETIVAAKMIVSGQRLYSEIFNHHGPLTFLPGVLLGFFGDFDIPGYRVLIAVFQALAMASIYFSPMLGDAFSRKTYTVSAASVMLLYFPELFGSMYMYQVMAGLIIVVILAQYTLPVMCAPEKISSRHVVLGNALIACLPFLAITYAPIAFLFFVSSLRKQFLMRSIYSLVGSGLINIIILFCIGSVAGFFAFHIYLNSEILPLYNGGQTAIILIKNSFESATGNLAGFSLFLILVAALSRLSSAENGFPWRSVLLGLGMASLLIRGPGFHGLPYYYALLVIPLVFFAGRTIVYKQSKFVVLLFLVVCLVKVSLLIPGDKEKLESARNPVTTEFSRIVQQVTAKDDRIIAYSFNNNEYIAADRLPASGNFFYLPWQAKYNENPKYGVKIDSCKEISEYRPKIMLISKWKVWDQYSWDSYAGCIQEIIDREYTQYPDRPYYLRNDVAEHFFKGKPVKTTMLPSAQLDSLTPIKLHIAARSEDGKAEIKRVGLMFGTYVRKNSGIAELHLKRLDGSDIVQRFSLPDLVDNQYYYFDIDSKISAEGEIISVSGGGISTWESHDENGKVNTCMIYEYVDGSKEYTRGCL